jgi:hypothetical protein
MPIPAPLASAPSPTSAAATDFPPPIVRTVFVLTDQRGWPVTDVCEVGWASAPDPMVAVKAGCAWLDQDVALARLKAAMAAHQELILGLAAVELVLTASGWVAASIAGGQL